MPKTQDPFRKHVEYLEKRKWRCTFCKKVFAGSTPRIRAHLGGILNHGIKACENVKDSVRAEALATFNGKDSVLDKSTGGTSGEGRERIVIGASQFGIQIDDGSNPNDTQNLNQPGCVPQQPSCH
ncbi:hypothetical protein ACJRO7_009620 [Eucalyptus globulus]|uniref:BED-type domain-containing protein n=1 Tax=Eucalyptus globulus TaxID=34317 RepID=A0ABD3LEA2_EUCGL